MHIAVTGTRGIPGIPGGVETHCAELYPRIVEQGMKVTIVRRKCYVGPENKATTYKGVNLIDVYAPRRKSLEAIVHTFLAVVKAKCLHADVVHIHTIGPSLMAPLARLLRMKVVCTHHGSDYNRDKWGRMAKWALHAGEWCMARFAHHIIVINAQGAATLSSLYGRTHGVTLIYNGVSRPSGSHGPAVHLQQWGLEPQGYVLAVARFVPEKRLHLLVEAFTRCNHGNIKLVLAGDADHNDSYSARLKAMARRAGVVLTGFVTGQPLDELWAGARLFVLPSAHEGLPISLLEAMSWSRDVLVSDIAANRLPELSDDDFFAVDSVDALAQALSRKLAAPAPTRHYDLTAYDWNRVAAATAQVYRHLS